jgi:hypothetical protein
MQITEQQHKAAGEIIELITAEFSENRAIYPGTAISSCARLSGSFLFRSFDFPTKNISPGSVVLSEQANEKGPVLINILGWTLNNLDINIDANKLMEASKAESNLSFLDTLNLLQNKAATIMYQNKLNFEQMAYSCAMAAAFLIKECQPDLTVESGFNTAIYNFVEGSKTYPPDLSNPTAKRKNIFTFWK